MPKCSRGKDLRLAPLMGLPGITLSRTTLRQNLEDPGTQWRSLSMLIERLEPDAAFPMMDLSVEAEALGCDLIKPENGSFCIADHPIGCSEDISKLRLPNPLRDGRLPKKLHVIREMSRHLDCINVAYVTGPFTLAGLLAGATSLIKSVLKNPEFVQRLVDFSEAVIRIYINALVDSGADMICILEPTAVTLSPHQFSTHSARPMQNLSESCPIPVIIHICGDSTALIDEMIRVNCLGYSLDSKVDLPVLARRIPRDRLILGNLDPVDIVAYGETEQIRLETRQLLHNMADKENFVLSTGCDLPMDTKMGNLELMCSLARSHFGEHMARQLDRSV
jgi:uroporphyrinogen decarboxylase